MLRTFALLGGSIWRIEDDVRKCTRRLSRSGGLVLCGLLLGLSLSRAQENELGHSIGKVSTRGDLIVVELDDGALGNTNLFDLTGHTLRFTPEGSRYRVENGALHWDSDFGLELASAEATLHQFAFPFSGRSWDSFRVGATGSIRFGTSEKDVTSDPYGRIDGGVSLGRFDQLAEAASTLVNSSPAICVFLKPRMSGPHYVKELPDRVVITWDLTEPFGSLLDFTWFKTINRFQAVLHRDGSIEMSYKELAAKDAIVGIYPVASGIRSSEVHFSSLTRNDGPFVIVYESFHYMALPSFRDLACTVIKTLGDKFDFLAYYSDFRVDNQEAGTPSDGPRGGNVSGIGERPGRPEAYCSTGRFQWEFIQPIYVGANQMQEHSPEGVTVERGGGKMTGYNLAMSQIGHELGHRWTADASAKVNGETIPLGPTHWARGLQAQVAFPYRRLVEASAMGGGVWQDNYDGTFTQLDDDYYVPADGYSPLDLYLMGLAAPSEVPDFFILRNLVPTGARDANGHPIFKADRTKLTIDDVIAAEGPRMPPCEQAQKEFNTGMVMVVTHGSRPSKELVERTNGIRLAWIDYWATTTGHRSKMTTNPR